MKVTAKDKKRAERKYHKDLDSQADHMRKVRSEARDIGPLPAIKNPARRRMGLRYHEFY